MVISPRNLPGLRSSAESPFLAMRPWALGLATSSLILHICKCEVSIPRLLGA